MGMSTQRRPTRLMHTQASWGPLWLCLPAYVCCFCCSQLEQPSVITSACAAFRSGGLTSNKSKVLLSCTIQLHTTVYARLA